MTIEEFLIQYALGSLTDKMICEIADDINAPKEILAILSTDKDRFVRCWVAHNPNTPKEVLEKLSTDKDNEVSVLAHANSYRHTD